MIDGLGELLTERRSVRAFSSRRPSRELLLSAFEGARWAPSSRNSQPWTYILGTVSDTPETHALIASLLGPRNRRYAPRAPALALSIARLREADGTELMHAQHDAGIALGFLILQARAVGLEVHPMAGFDEQRARAVFGIGDDLEPMLALAIGFAGDSSELPDGLGDRDNSERVRKDLAEVVKEPT